MSEPAKRTVASRRARQGLLTGVASVWGVQLLGMLLQLVYAGVTARVFPAAVFGAYAAAMSTIAIAALFAVSGATKASARSLEEGSHQGRALISSSLLIATALMFVVMLLAGPIATLWGVPQSASMIRLLAFTLPVSAYAGVLLGVLRRRRRITAYNLVTAIATVTGIVVGVMAVQSGEAVSLVVMPITVQVVSLVLGVVLLQGLAMPALKVSGAGREVVFSLRSSTNSALTYVATTVPLVVLARSVGPGALGSWNRATSLTQVPVESATSAWTTIFFSVMRGEREGSRQRNLLWSDMVVASAFVVLPTAGAILPAVPAAVSLILGPGWPLSGQMAAWLWVSACIVAVNVVLFTALEATDNFPVLWTVQAWRIAALAAAAVAVALTENWLWLGVGMVASALSGLLVTVITAGRRDLLHGRRVGRQLTSAFAMAAALCLPGLLIAGSGRVITVSVCALVAVAYLGCLLAVRRRLPALDRLLARD